jgi:hypothetical protein
MLNYKTKNDKEDSNAYIPECCGTVTTDDPNCCDCCSGTWTEDLKVITRSLKEWTTKADKLSKYYTLRSGWRDKLKGWYDDMTLADEKSDDLVRQIELFINHLNKICLITEETTKAIKYLFCMVEDLYIRIDLLKDAYDELMTCITTAKKTHSELDSSQGVLKCLDDYGKKLISVTGTRDVIITTLTQAIELMYQLHESLCLREENCGEGKPGDYGLINIIMYWRDVLYGTISTNHGKCQFQPFIHLPIDESHYYKKLENDWKETRGDVEDIKKRFDAAKEKRDSFTAYKDSIEKALKEVDRSVICATA